MTDFPESQRQVGADWTCPRCRASVYGDLAVCWRCGATEEGGWTDGMEAATEPGRPAGSSGPDVDFSLRLVGDEPLESPDQRSARQHRRFWQVLWVISWALFLVLAVLPVFLPSVHRFLQEVLGSLLRLLHWACLAAGLLAPVGVVMAWPGPGSDQ